MKDLLGVFSSLCWPRRRTSRPGQFEALSLQIRPGTYTLYCSLPTHESLGIKGTLTVSK